MLKKAVGWLLAVALVITLVNVFQDPAKSAHIGRTTGHLIRKGGEAGGNALDAAATAADAATGGK